MAISTPSYVNADRRALADVFAACPIGGTVSYDQLSAALGSPVRARRYLIPAALKLVLAEAGAAFAVIKGVGYRRLKGEEAAIVGHASRRRVRRITRRSIVTMSKMVAVANDMPDAAQREAYREISVAGLLNEMAQDRKVRKLALPERPQPTAVVLAETLRHMAS